MVALDFQNTQDIDPRRRVKDNDNHRLAALTVKALVRLARFWRLKNIDAGELVGVSPRTWERMKSDSWSGNFSKDQMQRASALIGLYKALHLYFGEELADEWVSLANEGSMFGGRSPIDAMKDGGLPSLLETRAYVDALRGGV